MKNISVLLLNQNLLILQLNNIKIKEFNLNLNCNIM